MEHYVLVPIVMLGVCDNEYNYVPLCDLCGESINNQWHTISESTLFYLALRKVTDVIKYN